MRVTGALVLLYLMYRLCYKDARLEKENKSVTRGQGKEGSTIILLTIK